MLSDDLTDFLDISRVKQHCQLKISWQPWSFLWFSPAVLNPQIKNHHQNVSFAYLLLTVCIPQGENSWTLVDANNWWYWKVNINYQCCQAADGQVHHWLKILCIAIGITYFQNSEHQGLVLTFQFLFSIGVIFKIFVILSYVEKIE